MEEPIPEVWKKDVCAILRSAERKHIIMRESARLAWSATFPAEWTHDLYEALEESLEDPQILGRQIEDMEEPGEVYAFWFRCEGKKLYAKIGLEPGRRRLIIYSAHLPRKGEGRL
jgi:hypothetical protein